jgi:acyl-CoA thioesterase-2
MNAPLRTLLDLLRLERIDRHIFRGPSQDLGWGRMFGGQVLGQALSAAAQTVPGDRIAHSLHAYFLRPGDAGTPVVFVVDPIRDGRSFSTRRVVARQDGTPIFHLSASFQGEEPGFEHQDTMPAVPGPDGLATERELAQQVAHLLPPALAEQVTAEGPFEIRPVKPRNPVAPKVDAPHRHTWVRTHGGLSSDQATHRTLLAWFSDAHFLTTSMQPHGVSWMTRGMQVASLDHAMWFHRPLRIDEWLLYDVHSPTASGARGLVRGRFFAQDGTLVASVVQEGLIRDRRG